MTCSGQGVRLTLCSRISIFALSYCYLFCLRLNMELIIYCRPRRQFLSLLIATLILIKLPSAWHDVIKTTQRFCHCMVCTNKKHRTTNGNVTLTSTNYYNSKQTQIFRFLQANFDTMFWAKNIRSYCNNTFLHLLPTLFRKTIFN